MSLHATSSLTVKHPLDCTLVPSLNSATLMVDADCRVWCGWGLVEEDEK